MNKVLAIVLALVVILGGGGYLLATQADAATPAQPLYTVDVLAESIERFLTFNPVAKAELEQRILDERAEEILALVEDEVDEEVLSEAIEALEKQTTRTQERVQLLADENVEDAEMERIQNRYEEQLQEQVQNMEKVQTQYKNMGEETMQQLQNMQGELNGNVEQNQNNNTGEDTQNQESNSETNGNTTNGNSGTSGNTGSTGGNGRN